MYKLSEILSKPILSLFNGKVEGTIKTAIFDKKLQKKDLTEQLNISSTTIAKMGKGEKVSMDVLERICRYLNCDLGDIASFEIEENDNGCK